MRKLFGLMMIISFLILVIPMAIGTTLGGDFQLPTTKVSKTTTPKTIEVWLTEEKKTVKVDFEDYVTRVTASEMPANFEKEALKAQSVAARTYAMAKIVKYQENHPESHPKAPVCDTIHCQVYKTEKQLIDCHLEGWESSFKKLKKALTLTLRHSLYCL